MILKNRLKYILFICVLNFVNCDNNNYKIIQTEYGPIRGQKLLTLFDEKPYYSFKGIPFIEPPVNDLRFKAPQPPKKWAEVKDAFEFGNRCVQNTRDNKIIGHEDCLYINVFVPENPTNKKLPVMLFIHGGGYYYGSSNCYGPDFLVSNDVILVTFNYRLGVLGFLSLGTPEYSGNMGMKDQRAAIEWVSKNIDKFGGDPKQITLFGESAGGSSVHMHSLVPSTRSLFQRAILQSGSALNTWAYYRKSSDFSATLYETVKKLGHNPNSNDELLTVLRKIDPHSLIQQTSIYFYTPGSEIREGSIMWEPIVEVPNAINPFMSKFPEEYLQESAEQSIDMLIGYTSGEMYFAIGAEMHEPKMLEPFDKTFKLELPWNSFKYCYNSTLYQKISKEIREFYFPNGVRVDKDTLTEYNNLLNDIFFVYAQHNAADLELARSKGKIFFYIFTKDTDLNVPTKLSRVKSVGLQGVSHLDDLFYMFKLNDPYDKYYDYNYEQLSKDSVEVKAIRKVSKLWTNFAKYGTPTPNKDIFKPLTRDSYNYVDITNDRLVPGVGPLVKRMYFWDNLYRKYKNSFDSYYFKLRERDEL